MSTLTRLRIAVACALVGSIAIGIDVGILLTGHPYPHAAISIIGGIGAIAGGLTYLRSSRRRP